MKEYEFNINGKTYKKYIDEDISLLYFLREVLDLTGTKCACNSKVCGACKVLVDGKAYKSCSLKAYEQSNKKIETIESFAKTDELHPIQEAFIESGAVQCGYCIPGMIINTQSLLNSKPNPTDDEIRNAFADNLCRCTGYVKIIKAVKLSAIKLGGAKL